MRFIPSASPCRTSLSTELGTSFWRTVCASRTFAFAPPQVPAADWLSAWPSSATMRLAGSFGIGLPLLLLPQPGSIRSAPQQSATAA
jgi:hypothetical protein